MGQARGAGTKLQYHNGTAFVDVYQRVQVVPPGMENPPDDRTHLDSTWRAKGATIPDGGEVTCIVQHDPSNATHAAILANFIAGTDTQWKVLFTDVGAAEAAFNGHVSGWAWGEATVENHIRVTLTIAVNGAVALTP